MSIRLYVDEDAAARGLVAGLRARAVDVVTAYEAHLASADDQSQLAYASAQGRVLYTFNVGHFYRLHTDWLAQERPHAGIIVVHRQKYAIGEQIRRLLKIINTQSADDLRGRLLFL